MQMIYLLPLLTAYLYRLGGGRIWPFKSGHKWVRRYFLPCVIGAITTKWLYVPAFMLILTFNLDEIEDKNLEEVVLYGLAQSFCLSFVGFSSILTAISWISVVYLSNSGVRLFELREYMKDVLGRTHSYEWKLDWFWAEFIHGVVIGLVVFNYIR